VAIAAVGVAIAVFPRYVSAYSTEKPEGYSEEEADAQYRPIQAVIAGSMIVIGAVFVFCVQAGFVSLNRYLVDLDGPSYFRFVPQTAIWWFFPGIGARTLAWEITLQVWGDVRGPECPRLVQLLDERKSAIQSQESTAVDGHCPSVADRRFDGSGVADAHAYAPTRYSSLPLRVCEVQGL
jgi:hypothetical protein